MFHCLYRCCLPLKIKENNSQDFSEDWSSTIYLLNKSCPKIIDSALTVSEPQIYILPTVSSSSKKDFSDLFQLAYQKCLNGPLTSIPRPLKCLK